VIRRVRPLANKTDTEKAALDVNAVIALVQRELTSHLVSCISANGIRTHFAEDPG